MIHYNVTIIHIVELFLKFKKRAKLWFYEP